MYDMTEITDYRKQYFKRKKNAEYNRRSYRKAANKEAHERHNKKDPGYLKKYMQANPKKAMLKGCKDRARKNGWEFDLLEIDIEIPEFCPVLGIKLERSKTGRSSPNSPSIDRIDSSKGYIRGNIIVVSWRANALKNDATPEELVALARFYGNSG